MAENKWVVISSRLYRLDPAGKGDPRRQLPHDRGEVLTGLSDDEVRHFLAAEGIAPYGSDAAKAAQNPAAAVVVHPSQEISVADAMAAAAVNDYNPVPAGDAADVPPTSVVSVSDGAEVVTRPPKSAVKSEFVKYAVASGQMTEEQALATSRNELRDKLK